MTPMSISLSNLLDAIAKDDFPKSAEQLSLALQYDELKQITPILQDIVENDENPSLKIRDHVVDFIGANPFYLAIEIPSYKLLDLITSSSRDAAKLELYHLVKEWLDKNDSCFVQEGVEIGHLGNTMYASLLPEILVKRIEELENCIIPFSKVTRPDGEQLRFCVAGLYRTSYGKWMIHAAGLTELTNVVGEKIWNRLSKSLDSLGMNVKTMLREVQQDDWLKVVREQVDKNPQASDSKEILQVRQIRRARVTLSSGNSKEYRSALVDIRNSKTRICNDVVMEIARTGSLEERSLAIDVLIASGSQDVESFIGEMLPHADPYLRTKIARGLSFLASRDFIEGRSTLLKAGGPTTAKATIHQLVHEGEKKSLETLQILANHDNKLVRIEAVRALVGLSNDVGNDILVKMMSDPETSVRLEIIRKALSLSNEHAKAILKIALSDPEIEIRNEAESIVKQNWPEDWPSLP
jgi:hypothetical protein